MRQQRVYLVGSVRECVSSYPVRSSFEAGRSRLLGF
jgi:hypothetical protein